jgi:hypothetical protein
MAKKTPPPPEEPAIIVPAKDRTGTGEWMLTKLSDEGENCESDYDDGADGWFGWRLHRDGVQWILTVRWTPDEEGGQLLTRSWKLFTIPEVGK